MASAGSAVGEGAAVGAVVDIAALRVITGAGVLVGVTAGVLVGVAVGVGARTAGGVSRVSGESSVTFIGLLSTKSAPLSG